MSTGQTSGGVTALGWLTLGVGIFFLCGQYFGGVNPQDEGELLTYPWLISQGHMLYSAIWAMYPPATFWLLAGLFKVGVPGMLAERGLGLAVRLACIVLVNHAVTGRWARFSWTATTATFCLLFLAADISLVASPWLVGLPMLMLGLLCVRKGTLWSAVAVLSLASTFRLEFGLAGLVALGTLASLEWRSRRTLGATAAPFLALLAGILGLHAALALLTGGPMLQDTVLDPIFGIEQYRRVSLFPPVFGVFGIPAALALLVGPPCMALVGLRLRHPPLVATNLAVCALLVQVVQDADWGHLFGVAALGVPWVIIGLIDLLKLRDSAQPARGGLRISLPARRWVGRALVVITVAVTIFYAMFVLAYAILVSPFSPGGALVAGKGPVDVVGSGATMIVARSPAEARDDTEVIGFLRTHSRAHDKGFVAPANLRSMEYNMTALYYSAGLTPASRYLEMDPGLETSARVQREIVRDLQMCRWVVLWKDPAGGSGHVIGSAVLERYIQESYRHVFENGTYVVLERRLIRSSDQRSSG